MRRVVCGAVLGLVLGVVVGACKVADLDHCLWRGEHGFCASSFPDAPYCSPCAALGDTNGCVAEPPKADECPAFESPETSSSSGGSSSGGGSSSDGSSSSGGSSSG